MIYPRSKLNCRLWPQHDSRHQHDSRPKHDSRPQHDYRFGRNVTVDFGRRDRTTDLAAAPPPDVRQGYALPLTLATSWGSAPGTGSAPKIWAKAETRGA